jgi:hypothetical protein
MKLASIAVALAAACVGASAQTTVGVSVQVAQPGLYGRIDIGNVPQPPVLVYQQPVIIAPSPVAVQQRPIYLRVPPGHEKNWAKHCAKYNACGQRVYFVREDWYQQHYMPAVRADEGRGRDGGGGNDQGRGHGKGGHGKGHGKHGD